MIEILALWAAGWTAPAAPKPSPSTARAFDDYVAIAEKGVREEESSVGTFVVVPPTAGHSAQEAALRKGDVVIQEKNGTTKEIPGGLIHHWTGSVLIPHVTVADVLAVAQDYDHSSRYYTPEVMTSKLIARDGDDFRIALRLREHKVITVVMDSEYDVRYGRLDATHQYSWSRSTSVAEIADASSSHERAVSDADNHGYMWRLNSYWRFAQQGDDVVVECEAISLTRNIPTGLGWLIGPFVREIPRESLETTLRQTRDAVAARAREEQAKQTGTQVNTDQKR